MVALKWELLREEPPEAWNVQCGWTPRSCWVLVLEREAGTFPGCCIPLGTPNQNETCVIKEGAGGTHRIHSNEGQSQEMSSHSLGMEMERGEVAEGWDSPGHREV